MPPGFLIRPGSPSNTSVSVIFSVSVPSLKSHSDAEGRQKNAGVTCYSLITASPSQAVGTGLCFPYLSLATYSMDPRSCFNLGQTGAFAGRVPPGNSTLLAKGQDGCQSCSVPATQRGGRAHGQAREGCAVCTLAAAAGLRRKTQRSNAKLSRDLFSATMLLTGEF